MFSVVGLLQLMR